MSCDNFDVVRHAVTKTVARELKLALCQLQSGLSKRHFICCRFEIQHRFPYVLLNTQSQVRDPLFNALPAALDLFPLTFTVKIEDSENKICPDHARGLDLTKALPVPSVMPAQGQTRQITRPRRFSLLL